MVPADPETPDPFEHFAEQQRSFELLEEHKETLAAQAAETTARDPRARPVGLILDEGTSELAQLRSALERAGAPPVPKGTMVCVVPRELALKILRTNHPATLDWLDSNEGEHGGHRLPLVAITPGGARLGAIDYDPEV